MNKWKRKVRALAKLADDQRGKPEGDVACQKLLEIINRHPEAAEYEPVVELVKKDITLADLGKIKRSGIGLDGEWTGVNLQAAIAMMLADYRERLARAEAPKLKRVN